MTQRPNTLNSSHKFVVRLTLATGATVATVIGANTLALLEHRDSPPAQNTAQNTAQTSAQPSANPATVALTNTTGKSTANRAAPKLVINQNGATAGVRIIPPNPKLLPPPAQVVQNVPAAGQAAQPASNQQSVGQSAPSQPQAQAPAPQPAPAQPAPPSKSSR